MQLRSCLLALLIACGGAQHSSSSNPDDPLANVPEAAANTLRAESGGNAIEHVEHETENGQETWEATWHEGGTVHEVSVTADGKIVEHETENAAGDREDDDDREDTDHDRDDDGASNPDD